MANSVFQAYATRDRGLAALRRAVRTAIVMPGLFALGDKVFGNPELATFAAFGSFAMLLLVDFGGPMRERLQAQAALAVTGAVFVCLGTLASQTAWGAALAMAVVGLAVLFSGVVSSVLAGATTSLLLAFILPVSLAGSPSSIPDRLEGWALASVVALLAVAFAWPAPAQDPLRAAAARACRTISARLRADVACVLSGPTAQLDDTRTVAATAASGEVAALHRLFLATPFRPTGLSSATRSVVRLVDELTWLDATLTQPAQVAGVSGPAAVHACAVKSAAAEVLEAGAGLLERSHRDPQPLRAGIDRLHEALVQLESDTTEGRPAARLASALNRDATTQPSAGPDVGELVSALDPSFRAQELSFAVSLIGRNIDAAAAAERRSWLEQVLGRQPAELPGALTAASERAGAHVERHSLWLHNSLRGAVGLGLAVLVANLTGVQHSFWVVLGTLSVLRSSALNTGQNALRAVLGTAAGFAVGSVLLLPIGTHTTVLWFLLPPAILLAGVAPAAISFAAGQAAFTLVLVILFNIIAPAGWRVGLLRVEDIALGCAVSLVVGVLLWPRGAAAALGRALAEAYTDSADYLASAVDYGMSRCVPGLPGQVRPAAAAATAASAARRLDDTFRGYLAERGAKPVPLAGVASLVTGVAGLRLAADAVLDLWDRDDGEATGNRIAAQQEVLAGARSVRAWYDDLAASLLGRAPAPAVLEPDAGASARLVEAVRHDLSGPDGKATATAIRMVWTADHVDAARRLQAGLLPPTQSTIEAAPTAVLTRFSEARWLEVVDRWPQVLRRRLASAGRSPG